MNFKRVVITGLGALTPIGNNVSEYWEALLNGVSGASPITHFDPEHFKTKFACELKNFNVLDYMDNREARKMDPCSHYALISTKEAFLDSGLDTKKVDLNRAGVIFGTGIGGFTSITESVACFLESDRIPRFNPFFIPKVLGDLIPGFISIHYGFKGPNYITSSACASAANAIVDAYHFIKMGKCDVVISGGSEACIVETAVGGFNAMHALSTRNDDPTHASRPFDVNRDGFVMGEGAATVILEELEHAKARGAKIYAEIIGVGLTADAYHITAPHPDGSGAINSMNMAIQDAQLTIFDIDHINTHGTSTPIGDVSECKAIETLFGDQAYNMVINSTKSMTGHLLGAAPAIESVATILALKNGIIPPTINLVEKDPQILDWNFVANKSLKRDIRTALSNSFGFGGHNVTLLFKKFE
ncbi:MAG: beta-ketoacyl-ACP synthase II [Bacteroidales bacterium]